jgi:hypothetical protein
MNNRDYQTMPELTLVRHELTLLRRMTQRELICARRAADCDVGGEVLSHANKTVRTLEHIADKLDHCLEVAWKAAAKEDQHGT